MNLNLALLAAYMIAVEAKDLRFNEKGKFKMVQFTDLHFGEDE